MSIDSVLRLTLFAAFLWKARPSPNTDLKRDLLRKVSLALGGPDDLVESETDISGVEKVLFPIFKASPKNDHGRLDEAAARYTLHRFFMAAHGWDIRSFEDADESSDESSQPCLFNFGRAVPYKVQAVLEAEVVERGSSDTELSVFAVTLEYLINGEVPGKLRIVYHALEIPTSGSVELAVAEDLIDLYMAAYIRTKDLTVLTVDKVKEFMHKMPGLYNNWEDTRLFFRKILRLTFAQNVTKFTFGDVLNIVLAIKEKFAAWNNRQCHFLKEQLLTLESEGSGRVLLIDFYDSAIHKGYYQFRESIDYLRQLGALDESDPYNPSVVIPNYLDGPSNCVARTSYYSVCCMDECMDMYSRLEKEIGKPEASPSELLSAFDKLGELKVLPQSLTSMRIQRLQQLGRSDGVRLISLHGQDFAEWMHFSFPRECTNAAMFGSARYMIMEEWERETHMSSTVGAQELRRYIEELGNLSKLALAGDSDESAQKEEVIAELEETTLGQLIIAVLFPRLSWITFFCASASLILLVTALATSKVTLRASAKRAEPKIRQTFHGMLDHVEKQL